jgi:Nif-specific regulatory protein
VSGARDDYVRRAEELLRGTRWEPEVREIQDELRRGEEALANGDVGDQRLLILLRTSEILNSILSFEEVVPRLMDLVLRSLNAERGIIFLLDDANTFHPVAKSNIENDDCLADAMEYSQNILRRAAEDQVLWSGNAVTDKRFSQYESIAAFNIKSFMCVPIKRRGKIVGTIYVDNRSLENSFGTRDVEFMRILANHAGVALENARLHDRLKAENVELRSELKRSIGERLIIGEDAKVKKLMQMVERVADSDATVLVIGESGTGKELVARAIHQNSARLGQPFVAINCAAIPENLLESELFGHTKGAFTGATANRIGKFEAANKGTLFLDEIGDMSLPLQAKMLRVLQEGKIEPVGSNKSHDIDVRIVAATNRDLAKMATENQFREDLFYRLNVIRVDLPPLRERGGDIEILARHFLARSATSKTVAREFSPAALQLLRQHNWPGNIRELENVMTRLVLLASNEIVEPEDIKPLLGGGVLRKTAADGAGGGDVVRPLDVLEREAIKAALAKFDGNRTAAAQALGIAVRTLQYKIKEYQQAGFDIG